MTSNATWLNDKAKDLFKSVQEEDKIRKQIVELQKKARSLNNNTLKIKDEIKGRLNELGATRLKTELHEFKIVKSRRKVVITDPTLVPKEYLVTTVDISKAKILESNLTEVPGVSFESGETILIKSTKKV